MFSAELDCETFEWEYSPSFNTSRVSLPEEYYNVSLPLSAFPPACAKTDITAASCSLRDYCINIEQTDLSTRQGQVFQVKCSEGKNLEEPRILIYQADAGAAVRDETGSLTLGPPHVDDMVGAICTPKYSLTRRTVTNSTRASDANEVVNVSGTVNETLSLGATIADITTGLVDSMTGESIALLDSSSDTGDASGPVVLWFDMLSAMHSGTANDAFNKSSLIANVSQRAFPIFAAQWAKSGKMVPANQTVEGVITQTSERLCVQELSLRLMEGFLGVLILASAALSFLHYVRREESPESLLSHVMVLAQSQSLERVLNGMGALPEKEFKSLLKDRTFQASKSQGITRSGITVEPADAPEMKDTSQAPMWQPMGSSWAFRITTIVIVVVLVFALELLYQYSSTHDGIADVSTEGYTKYAWLFIPTLTLSLVALFFSLLDFATRLLHPYQELQKGNTGVQTLLFEPLGKPTAVAIFQALKRKKYSLLAILLTALIGPVLTIATSGLYTADPVPTKRVFPLKLDDWYDFSLSDKSESRISVGGNDVTVADLIAFDNVSYPRWTYDELAFPTLHLDEEAVDAFAANMTLPLTARLPAVRAQMNCSLNRYLTDQNFTYDATNDFSTTVEPVLPCKPRTKHGIVQTAGIQFSRVTQANPSDGFFAYHAGADSLLEPYQASDSAFTVRNNFCNDSAPHLWFLVGNQAGALTTDLALLHCQPYIEALQATTHLSYPSLRIDTSTPPAPLENTAFFLSRNHTNLDIGPTSAPMTLLLAMSNNAQQNLSNTIDPFFEALIWGLSGTPIPSLLGESNIPTLLAQMERQYRRRMAQALRFSFRRAATAAVPTVAETALLGNLTAEVVDGQTRLRLVQSAGATRALEGLLLAMVVCVVVAMALARGEATRVLPRDPGCVGSKMGLLAGSGVVERVRGDVEWVREMGGRVGGEWEVVRALEGEVFGLGWWDGDAEGDGDGGRRFGIGMGDVGKE